MLEGIVSFLLYLLVAGLVVWAVHWFIGLLTLPEPIRQIILVIVAIIAILWLVSSLGLFGTRLNL